MKKIVLAIFTLGFLLAPQANVLAQSYDIKQDYCGIHSDANYCQCAFHGQNCASTGFDQAGAEAYVYSQFDAWTTEQEIARCDALGMDYEGECVEREVKGNTESYLSELICLLNSPGFWDDFWDDERDDSDDAARMQAFAKSHGFDNANAGETAIQKMVNDRDFRTSVEQQVEGACGLTSERMQGIWGTLGGAALEPLDDEVNLVNEEMEDDDEDDDEEDLFFETVECNEAGHEQFDRKTKDCICMKLWRKDQEGDCVFTGDDGANLAVESSIELTTAMDEMNPNERTIFNGKNDNGEEVTVGIIRKPNGEYSFTPDGIHFYDNPKDAIKPGLVRRAKTALSDIWGKIKIAFGVGKYTAKDTADDPDKQAEGQQRFDAAVDAFTDLKHNPKPAITPAESNKVWADRLGKIIEGKGQEFVETELTKATGLDAKVIGEFLRGEYSAIADSKLSQLTTFLQTSSAQSVIILAEELRTADFANGAYLYIEEREKGLSQAEVTSHLSAGDLVELEFISEKGIGYEQSKAELMAAYEDAYQRYLLRGELSN